jgi:hypothetical protein
MYKHNKFSPSWVDEYKNGDSTKVIAKRAGVSSATVWRHLKRLGVLKTISEKKVGANNPMWVGDKVGYHALHAWVHRNKPKPSSCEMCRKELPLEAANISQEYKRDIDDWRWLCRRCHMISDGRMNNLKQYA